MPSRSGLERENKPIKKRKYNKKQTFNESNQEAEESELNLVLQESVTEKMPSSKKKKNR
jgi:hypothetical protein